MRELQLPVSHWYSGLVDTCDSDVLADGCLRHCEILARPHCSALYT